jgi:hypothetical protein
MHLKHMTEAEKTAYKSGYGIGRRERKTGKKSNRKHKHHGESFDMGYRRGKQGKLHKPPNKPLPSIPHKRHAVPNKPLPPTPRKIHADEVQIGKSVQRLINADMKTIRRPTKSRRGRPAKK